MNLKSQKLKTVSMKKIIFCTLKKTIIVTAILLAINLSTSVQAQYLSLGLRAGLTYSIINDLHSTILSEPYFLNYKMDSLRKFGGSGGGFIHYMPDEDRAWMFGLDIEYMQRHGGLEFHNYDKDFNYEMGFNYNYLHTTLFTGVIPFISKENFLAGFEAHVGLQLGINLSPDNITYKSWGVGVLPDFGSDLEQQQQLRNVLKGKTNFGPVVGLAYAIPKTPFKLNLRYLPNLTDDVETLSNSYNFIENDNHTNTWQFSLDLSFPVIYDDQKPYLCPR